MIGTFSDPTDTRGWEIIKKHFFEEDGLLAQVEQGRILTMKMDASRQIEEVQEVKEALEIIRQSWEGKETLPTWHLALLWNVVLRLEKMWQDYPEQALALHILWAKFLTWLIDAAIPIEQGIDPEQATINGVIVHLKGKKSFTLYLRLGQIEMDAFEELVQALQVLQKFWQGRTILPRLALSFIVNIPLADWDASFYTHEQKRQLERMKQHLYKLISECLGDNTSDEPV